MTVTVQSLIDQARIRHAAFMDLMMPDGALLLFLNQKQRSTLLALSESIEPLVGESRQIASVIAGALVGSDGGVPYYITTSGDGYAVQSEGGVPYVDFTQPPIALDPFGLTGSAPGFPLPVEFIKMINVIAATASNAALPVSILPESSRAAMPQRTLSVFINGNRLVPIRQGIAPYSDVWSDVVSVTLSYIAMQTLVANTDVVKLPLQLVEVLITAMAERFAFASPSLSLAEKRLFTEHRERAEQMLSDAAGLILGEVTTSHVQFNG